MTAGEKERLLESLTESQSALRAAIEGIDPETRIYSEPSWQIRDILGHIATWDREVTKSLRAFLEGGEYAIANLEEDDFNDRSVKEQRTLTAQQVYADWEQAREDFKGILMEIPPGSFPGDLLYPWGDERGGIATLVEYMVAHDEEHRDEIVKALQGSKEI